MYKWIMAPKKQIQYPSWYKFPIWAVFGNEDDGYIGDKNWNPLQEDTAWIRIKWWVRNPFHNLVFYVLGCAHKESERYSTANSGVFKEDGGWMFAFSKTKYFVYPFVSYLGKIKFYIGWRERGNFGLKLTANSGWNNGK